MIKLDNDGHYSVVITCAACPFWSAIRLDMSEAHDCAVNHERIHHPASKRAWEAARKYRSRSRR